MEQEVPSQSIEYNPPHRLRRNYLAKKGLSLLAFGLMGGFLTWYAWPGITGPPAPLDPGYWTFLAGLLLGMVAVGFLVVVTWNERLPRIHDGVVDLPFPIRRTNRSRTRRIRIDEIGSFEMTRNSIGRTGAEIFLLDRTRLFLPDSVFGVGGRQIFEALAAQASQRSSQD